MSDNICCKWCGSEKLIARGRQYQCKECARYTVKGVDSGYEYSEDRIHGTANIRTSLPRIMSDEDLARHLNIDLDEWRIDKVVYGKSEGYRKDRQVDWIVRDGEVVSGEVHDSGKLLIEPLFSVKIFLSRKTSEKAARLIVADLVADAKKFAPKYPKIKYGKTTDHLYEIAMPDLQLGRLVAAEEAGEDNDPEKCIKDAEVAINELAARAVPGEVSRVLFPIGNDFFDSNTAEGMTVHGTPQRDDVRWQRTFRLGRTLMVYCIDLLSTLAPVDVILIPGNHDEERVFYLADVLSAWYHNNPNVTVQGDPIKRKYYAHGKNLIGLTHGYYEKPEKLAALMATEVPEMWAKSTHREWHLGDKHHKKDMVFMTDQLDNGVVVRILRSLASPSVWEFDKGYVGGTRAAESFLWHPTKGVVAQYTAVV